MTIRFGYLARWGLCAWLGLLVGLVAVRGDMVATVITAVLALLAGMSFWLLIPYDEAHR